MENPFFEIFVKEVVDIGLHKGYNAINEVGRLTSLGLGLNGTGGST